LLDSDAAFPADDVEKAGRDLPAPEVAEEPGAAGEDAWSTGIAGENQFEPLPGMIGRSEAMQRVYRLAQVTTKEKTEYRRS
jgi:hypothetical protein